ncbi:unnamed protein product [Rotaria socialis]|uniref:protein-disulfide reductase n=1 Tax=Rotaria socialis TaxID=392032 RepID=A0A821KEI8_9BILA|nr:unnamed protein product [Rotaria socialis]
MLAITFAVKTFDWSSTSTNQQVITTTTTTTTPTTTAFNQLLGYRLLQHDGHECAKATNYVNTTVLEGKAVALYFSAHWCRPSREFTVKLVEAYNSVYEDVKDKFEIVFLSWDNEESAFESFYKDMPWKALPFSVLNQNVTTIMNIAATKNLTTSLKTKPTETTALTLLLGEQLLQHSAEGKFQLNTYISTSELEGKTIALYFSGQSCQSSREFTLKLVEIYKSVYKDVKDKFEIVFISYDKDDKCFDSYYKQMPWKALPFVDRTRWNALKTKYAVGGIPCLVVLSAAGQILCSNGVQEVNSKDTNCVLRWARGRKCGECVSFVKKCTGDERRTNQWRQGRKVRDASISPGTAIATFPDGAYSGHAAIYMSQDHNGIHVWDQWYGHPVSQRIIRWNGHGLSNNGDSFYVVA